MLLQWFRTYVVKKVTPFWAGGQAESLMAFLKEVELDTCQESMWNRITKCLIVGDKSRMSLSSKASGSFEAISHGEVEHIHAGILSPHKEFQADCFMVSLNVTICTWLCCQLELEHPHCQSTNECSEYLGITFWCSSRVLWVSWLFTHRETYHVSKTVIHTIKSLLPQSKWSLKESLPFQSNPGTRKGF
jgi:hypothetical protein